MASKPNFKFISFIILCAFAVEARCGEAYIKPVTAYVSGTANLYFQRLANDTETSFRRYSLSKDNVIFITLGQEKDGEHNFICVDNTDYTDVCKQRFSFHYVNRSHLLLQINDVRYLDAGQFDCHKYFSHVGVGKDPGYEHIKLTVQAKKPGVQTKEINSTIGPRATSHHSVIHPFHCMLMLLVLTTTLALLY